LINANDMLALTVGKGLRIDSQVMEGKIDSDIPDTQWITEIVNWEYTAWSALQIKISDYAIGPRMRTFQEELNITEPTTKGDIQLCNSQRMRKNGGFV